MQMIYVFHVVICIFLILTILFQDGKAGGFAGPADNAAAKAVFGAKGAGDFLTKVTTYLAAFFMVTSLTLALLDSPKNESIGDDFVPAAQEETTSVGEDGQKPTVEVQQVPPSEQETQDSESAVVTEDGGKKTLGESVEGIDIINYDDVPEEIQEAHEADLKRQEELKRKQAEASEGGQDNSDQE